MKNDGFEKNLLGKNDMVLFHIHILRETMFVLISLTNKKITKKLVSNRNILNCWKNLIFHMMKSISLNFMNKQFHHNQAPTSSHEKTLSISKKKLVRTFFCQITMFFCFNSYQLDKKHEEPQRGKIFIARDEIPGKRSQIPFESHRGDIGISNTYDIHNIDEYISSLRDLCVLYEYLSPDDVRCYEDLVPTGHVGNAVVFFLLSALIFSPLSMQTIFSPSLSDRLDIVISTDHSLSLAFTHYLISKRLVWINGRYCLKKSVRVTPDDTITLIHKQRKLDPELLCDAPDIEIPIVFQHPDYLVIHKPKGVLTHPTTVKNTTLPSVTGFLYHYTKKFLPECHQLVRASIVHRLDRDTD